MGLNKTVRGRKPKILILDIEVAPMNVWVYGMWDQNISLKQLEKDWYMLSWAAKWVGEKNIMYEDSSKRRDVSNDKIICKSVHKLMCEADIIVGHNVERYDIKKLNTRFLKHGLDPVGKKQSIDTLKIAKKYFKITSNKLDYIAKFLGIEGKYKSKKYNGYDLWIACAKKVMEAFVENKKYNKQDVTITEKVFNKLKAWDETLNFQAYTLNDECICGSTARTKYGHAYTKTSVFPRYKCSNCKHVITDRKNALTTQQKAKLRSK